MKLWLKTGLSVGVSLVLLIGLLAVFLSTIILERFIAYEQQETQQDAARAADTLLNLADPLKQVAFSWGNWTAMYEYIVDPDPAFIAEQVPAELQPGFVVEDPESDFYTQIHTMLFINQQGETVWGMYYDQQQQQIVEPPAVLLDQLSPDHPLLQHPTLLRGKHGIMQLPNEVLLVGSHPIVTSVSEGPARGTVLVGRPIDDRIVAQVSATLRLPVNLYRIAAPNLPPDVQQAEAQLLHQSATPTSTLALPLNQQTVAGYALLSDAEDVPALIMQVKKPRTIYHHGRTSVIYLLIALGVVGIATGIGMSGLLHLLVVRRLARLDRHVQRIRSTDDLADRVTVSGRDEVSSLGESINSMLTTLQALVQERTAAQAAAEEANALKTHFIANMSHELRTPLNSIINFTYILKSGIRGPVTDEQVEYLDRVYGSGEHLLGMINDILDISKIEAGRMTLFKEATHLEELVISTMSSAAGLTKEKPIELRHEIAEGLPTVQVDKIRIRQVLLNLLSNAAKFTDTGTITVRVWQGASELITCVTDTGIGIAADKLPMIFEEFRQADEGSDRSYQGTGLGLSICKRLVEMHGGRIWVESTIGIGSTFGFSLPVGDTTPTQHSSAHPHADEQHSGPHVLVIDDDPAAIEIVQTYLHQDAADYAVLGVTDSRIALDEVRRWQPVVIILDILMPYKDGWELLVALKGDPNLRDIPVICYSIVDEQPLGLSLGADAYLIKPFEADILRHTVQQLVEHTAQVLVVDTDPAVVQMVVQALDNNGYRVVTTDDGQTALEVIAMQRPDLIILDLMLPEVDGVTLLYHLEQDDALRTIPVIVLQDTKTNESAHSYLHERVQHLVSKTGLTPQDMLAQVQQALYAPAATATTGSARQSEPGNRG